MVLSPFRGAKKAIIYSSAKTTLQKNLRLVQKFIQTAGVSVDRLIALQPLVLGNPHLFSAPGSSLRQSERAKDRARDRETDPDEQGDPATVQREAADQQRHQRAANGLPQQPRGPKHAAGPAAAFARGRRDHGSVVRGLEQAKSRPGQRHPPCHVEQRGMRRQPCECAEAEREQQETNSAEKPGWIALYQTPAQRRCEGNRDRRGRDQKTDLDVRISK